MEMFMTCIRMHGASGRKAWFIMAKHEELKKYIKIRKAAEHNLKEIDLDVPRDEFVVFTGLSGSGKSSLAFDTIYAEGQRRYMESMSSYARQCM